jgi:hypothetical protein
VEVAVVAAGALAHHVAARQLLAPDPVQRIVKGMRVAPFVPASTDAARDPHEHLLITLDDKGASEVSYASPGLVGLLAPDAPRTLTEMCAAAEALGADPGEGREIVEDLVRERLLVGYL